MFMDTLKRVKLQTNRDAIVEDLDVEEVTPKLLSDGILTAEDVKKISLQATRKDRARMLLDILPSKGSTAFESFVQSLERYYPWLREKLTKPTNPQGSVKDMQSYTDALLLGGVPTLPVHNVSREKKLSQLRDLLLGLKRGQYVVLHGMAGSGKSCLAADAIIDIDLLVNSFKGCVYWLSDPVTPDDLLPALLRLHNKMSSRRRRANSPRSITEARDDLKRTLAEETFREALIVLDDVCHKEVVSAFDLGCKVLVTTKDIGCMKDKQGSMQCMELSDGFSKTESLTLFSQCTKIPVSRLPAEADRIHYLCKGLPLVIALIGAQLAENIDDVQRNNRRWEFYLKKLANKDYRNIKPSPVLENELLNAIGVSIASLSVEMRKYYQDLALFVEDVNIKPEVFETLWSMNRYEVENLMIEFIKKSLVVRKWNDQLNSYVYGIHDLLLYYLKEQLSADEKKELHRRLLSQYRKMFGEKFANLPTDDNYIFSYLGYHLSQAEEWDTFKTLYYDLEFLEVKLKTSGLGDLLVDYHKYEEHITGGDSSAIATLAEYKNFVNASGLDLYRYLELDIVQCGLQQPRDSAVYRAAAQLAAARPDRLYFQPLLRHAGTGARPSVLMLDLDLAAACFLNAHNRILVAAGDQVHMWDTDYRRILHTFHGHRARVLRLMLRPDCEEFLSVSEDNSVKLWALRNIARPDTHAGGFDQHGYPLKTPSPRMRQEGWSLMFGNGDGQVDGSVHSLNHAWTVRHAAYSHDSNRVVTSGQRIAVWDCRSGSRLLEWTTPLDDCSCTCAFSGDDRTVLFAHGDTVTGHNASTGEFAFSLKNPSDIISLLPVPDTDQLVVTSNDRVRVWSLSSPQDGARELAACVATEAVFVCSAMSGDARYLVAADSQQHVAVWEVEGGGQLVRRHHDANGLVRCVDVFWLEDGDHLVMTGSDNGCVNTWRLEDNPEVQAAHSKLQSSFHAKWPLQQHLPVMATLTPSALKLVHGCKVLLEFLCEPTACRLSWDAGTLLFGCRDGRVYLTSTQPGSTPRQVLALAPLGVHLVDFLGQEPKMVVASTPTSWQIWRDGEDCILSAELNKLVKCFKLSSHLRVLTCSQDGSVKVWDLTRSSVCHVLVPSNPLAHISQAALSGSQRMLALTDAGTGQLHLAALHSGTGQPAALRSLDVTTPRSCAFSADETLLAVGHDSGDVTLWEVSSESVIATLRVHLSWVVYIAFSPCHPSHLVTLGDVLACWDIAAVARPRRRSSAQRRSLHLQGTQAGDAGADNLWCMKRGPSSKPELLAVVKLDGASAQRLDANADFTAFTTVDSSGNVYHLQAFQGRQLPPDYLTLLNLDTKYRGHD